MTMRGETLPNGAGFRCAGCGITVWADPGRQDNPQIPARLCTSCFARRSHDRPEESPKS